MNVDLVVRFEAKVDRSGAHHLWTGARKADGTGMFKVGPGAPKVARKVAWEIAHGPAPAGARVISCEVRACVRVDHLRLEPTAPSGPVSRRRLDASTRVQIQVNGVRVHRRVRGGRADVESARASLRRQLQQIPGHDRDAMHWSVDELVKHYLGHLEAQGREVRTRKRYASVAKVWLSPVIGQKRARRLSPDDVDRCFARMRQAGQSTGSMNYARALLSGAYRWGRRTGKVLHDPMLDFQLPKSTYRSREKLPPETADIALILRSAMKTAPEIVPILTLAATTGARLGELVALRSSDVDWERSSMWVSAAVDLEGTLKEPKRSQHRREVPLDEGTLAVLRHQIDDMRNRVAVIGTALAPQPFLFSLEPDCSRPMRSNFVTKRLQVVKGFLGVEDKSRKTIELEDEALRLRREGGHERTGRPGPPLKDGAALSYGDIARILGRTKTWAKRACESATRREQAPSTTPSFNLSFNGFRKFTSSELLDAGFNISVVAQRQGHTPEVLAKHYAKARMSARRQAAEHLGQVVHGTAPRGSTNSLDVTAEPSPVGAGASDH